MRAHDAQAPWARPGMSEDEGGRQSRADDLLITPHQTLITQANVKDAVHSRQLSCLEHALKGYRHHT